MIESPAIGLQLMNPSPPEKVFATRYFGSKRRIYTARGVREVESVFRRPGEFDNILHGQLESALQAGRSEIVVLDIGSGEGELFADFLRNPKVGKKSRAFLGAHPEFKVRMLGLTDSPNTESHLRGKPVNVNENKLDDESKRLKREQLEIKNVYYTLTRTKTLAKFLQAQNVDTVDFALATCSLMYFSPKVYEEVLQTTVGRMSRGGKFVASLIKPSFYDLFPNFAAIDFDEIGDMPVGDSAASRWLIRVNTEGRSIKDVEKDVAIHTGEQRDIEEEKRALAAACETYQRIGVLTEDDINQARITMEKRVFTYGLTERQKLYVLANIILAGAFGRLSDRKDAEFWQSASAVIDSLKGVTSDVWDWDTLDTTSDRVPRVIVFTKTE